MDEPQGGARLLALLARDLQEEGQDVTVYCYKYDRAGCFPDLLANIAVRSVHNTDSEKRRAQRSESGLQRSWAQLRRYFLESHQLAQIIRADEDILNPHEWPAHRSAALLGRKTGTPIVWTYNDPSRWHQPEKRTLRDIPYRFFGWLDTRQTKGFAAITTLSQWTAGVAERVFRSPVHVVRCGVDVRDVDRLHREENRLNGHLGIRLLSIGILAPWRRFEDAIEAVRMARRAGLDCRLEIIGSDRFAHGYGLFLRRLVGHYGLTDWVDLRFESVSEDELEKAFARADAAVFPNEKQAWGLAQLEAMARGMPVIVSRGAGVSEVLSNQEDSLLVEPRQPLQIL